MTLVPIYSNNPIGYPDGVEYANTNGSRPDVPLSSRYWVDETTYGPSPLKPQNCLAAHIEVRSGDVYGGSSGERLLIDWDFTASQQPATRIPDLVEGTESWYAKAILIPGGQSGCYWVCDERSHPPSNYVGNAPQIIVQQASPKLAINTGTQKLILVENAGNMRTSINGTVQRNTNVWTFSFGVWIRIIYAVKWSSQGLGRIRLWVSESPTMPAEASPTVDTVALYGSTHDTLQYVDGSIVSVSPATVGLYRSAQSFTSYQYEGGLVKCASYAEAVSAFTGGVASGGGGGGTNPGDTVTPPTSLWAGKDTIGQNTWSFSQDHVYLNRVAVPSAAKLNEVDVYCPANGTGTVKLKGVVYADDGTGKPGALLATSNEVTVASGATAGWQRCTFASPPTCAAGDTIHYGVLVGGASTLTDSGDVISGAMWEQGQAYASGAPATGGSMIQSNAALTMGIGYTLNVSASAVLTGSSSIQLGAQNAILTGTGAITRVAYIRVPVTRTDYIGEYHEVLADGSVGALVKWNGSQFVLAT